MLTVVLVVNVDGGAGSECVVFQNRMRSTMCLMRLCCIPEPNAFHHVFNETVLYSRTECFPPCV